MTFLNDNGASSKQHRSKREWMSGLRFMQNCERDSQVRPRTVSNLTCGAGSDSQGHSSAENFLA